MIRNMLAGAKAAVELRDGVLYLQWFRGAVIDEKDALAAMAAVSRLCQGRGRPMLVGMAGTAWLSSKARNVFARPGPVTRIALVGSSPVDRVIVNYFLARSTPPCPTRYFTSHEAGHDLAEGRFSGQDGVRGRMMCRRGFPEDPPSADVNTVLECLVRRLEAALAEVGSASHGRPLIEVEAALTERLRRSIPGARFSAEDIRTWSARISS